MNVFITRINGFALTDVAQYSQHMVANIAHQLGFKDMGIFYYDSSQESAESLSSRYDGIIAGIASDDIVIIQHPTWHNVKYEVGLANRIRAYGGKIAVFIHDVKALMFESNRCLLGEIIDFYNQAEVLAVPSYAMKQFLLENGVRADMKFVVQEIWDYTTDIQFESPKFKKEVHFAGSPEKFKFPDQWNYNIPLKYYSEESCTGQNVIKMGRMSRERLLMELADGGFGMVWSGEAYWQQYMRYNNSFKLSTYLSAGIPVIAPSWISNRYLIEKNHLGLVADSLDEAADMVEKMEEQEYQEYVRHVGQFAVLIRNGYFTKKLLIGVIHAMQREGYNGQDAGIKIYPLGQNVFGGAVLNKSYNGNLALSWDFKGDVDGFLVCDASGTPIYETENIYQHYFLIEGHKNEEGFQVKAYVNTLKGRMVVAETERVYVIAKSYAVPQVSIIIPAYNAEEYIARSIDTALAQSFPDLEIIIVNDGSTDGTQEVIDWYADNYSNVIVLSQKNQGVAAARNKGIDYANGDYIGFLDDDDMFRCDMVEKLFNSIKKNNCDIAVTSSSHITNESCDVSIYTQYPVEEDTAIGTDAFFELHVMCAYQFPVVWNKLYCASLVKQYRFRNIIYDDEAWIPYILSYSNRICYLDGCYYEHNRSTRAETLETQWQRYSNDEKFENHKRAILFYLENGNIEKRPLLKQLAEKELALFEKIYHFAAYKELREQIEEKY